MCFVSEGQTLSEIHSRAPLAFCLIGSLIRQASALGGMMTNIGFILLSTQFKARWKTGKSLFSKAPLNVTRLCILGFVWVASPSLSQSPQMKSMPAELCWPRRRENWFSRSKLHALREGGIDFICGDWLKDGEVTQTKARIHSLLTFTGTVEKQGLSLFITGLWTVWTWAWNQCCSLCCQWVKYAYKRAIQAEGKWRHRETPVLWHGLSPCNKVY